MAIDELQYALMVKDVASPVEGQAAPPMYVS